MSKSTPINQITELNDNTADSSNQLVQEIINEIQAQETQQQQQPQETIVPDMTEQTPMQPQIMMQMQPEESKLSVVQNIINNLLKNSREAGAVSGITLLLSFPAVNTFLLKYLPQAFNEGEINTIGLIVKALLAGVIFILVKNLL